MIKAIIFDCFGVLATDTWQAFLDSLPKGVDKQRARDARRAYDAGMLSKEEAAAEISAATGKHFAELDERADTEPAKNIALLKYVEHLRGQGYKTGILSNVASNWLRDTFLSADEQSLFDDFVLSYEVGLVKPDLRMFTIAAERLGMAVEEVVLVDDKERYCTTARELGMQAVCYQNLPQLKRELEKILSK